MLGLKTHIDPKKLTLMGAIISLGIAFGDIGTSPLYVMKAIVNARKESGTLNPIFLEGALSCIIWTLTLQTTIKYVIISLRAHNKGEGGILALFSLVKNLKRGWLYIIAIIGAAALIADGVITPSLTVMSAIEGLEIYNPNTPVVTITLIILTGIFTIQQFGTNNIGKFFGPVMALWFLMLGVLGVIHIFDYPLILKSFNPYYAVRLIITSPSIIVILGAVFLSTTGAEALYSDLGHCGTKNIRVSWTFAKTCLILNYLGQGAWLVTNYHKVFDGENPFFAMMPEWFVLPAVLMATAAAIIASQSLITGSFTIFSEAMSLNLWPLQEIDYPTGVKGQMYIPKINWGLLVFCFFVVLYFQESGKMEAAYGLSITVTMLMTTLLLIFYLFKQRVNKLLILLFALVYLSLELGFFSANVIKFFDGGWITVFLGGFIGISMYAWYNGRMIKTKFIKFVKLENYISTIQDMKLDETIPKYATNLAYFSRSKDPSEIESKIIYSIIRAQPKRADHYFILNIVNHEDPYTYEYKIDEILPGTIYRIHFILGFKVDRLINDYFQQVLNDMIDEGIIPDRSSHPSLRAHNIPPDLKYVVIDNVYINDYLLTVREKIVMNAYNFVRKMGSNDFTAFGLVPHNVVVESAPLLYNPVRVHKIKQVGYNRFGED
ncbi:KUP/HAK/KT family potassium transporter [Elizabethkingia sp. JS20170427COW]|uniref:KUP/HAK/KT family potassium transporter n=1 Tax=Elizabethkingia sp. JS20170427COW TaxID=2583851 RepID=UPI0011103E24|nr:KUP/HAK/KT family potassium transporter [Elizabethkingia sp. JS20170427COW]QCX53582.1 potassium transporter Kup [Elizabethkingia sp. JS20170427COW]